MIEVTLADNGVVIFDGAEPHVLSARVGADDDLSIFYEKDNVAYYLAGQWKSVLIFDRTVSRAASTRGADTITTFTFKEN